MASADKTQQFHLVHEPDPNWNGTYTDVVDPTEATRQALATVTFERCYWHMLGGPNDEVFDAHPLAGRGFEGQGAFLAHNSRWLEVPRAINSVHDE